MRAPRVTYPLRSTINWGVASFCAVAISAAILYRARSVYTSPSRALGVGSSPPQADYGILVDEAVRDSPSVQTYVKRMGGNYAVLLESEDSAAAIVEIGQDHPGHFEMGPEMKVASDGLVWIRDTTADRGDDWRIDCRIRKPAG